MGCPSIEIASWPGDNINWVPEATQYTVNIRRAQERRRGVVRQHHQKVQVAVGPRLSSGR